MLHKIITIKVDPRGSPGHTRSKQLSTLHKGRLDRAVSSWHSPRGIISCLEAKIPYCGLGSPSVMQTLSQQIVADAKYEIEPIQAQVWSTSPSTVKKWQLPSDRVVCSIIVVLLCVGSGQGECQHSTKLRFHAGQTEVCCTCVLHGSRENLSV